MEYEVAYREACDAADVREEHQPFDNKLSLNILDTAVNAVHDAKKAVVDAPNKLPDEYWQYAPDWANCAAMDRNGYWCWYRTEPDRRDDDWSNMINYNCFTAPPVSDWTKSLTKRPDNG